MVGLVFLVGLVGLVGSGVAGFLLFSQSGSKRVNATASMPFVLGDTLTLQIDNHSCDFAVLGIASDGRLIGRPCSGSEPLPTTWASLQLRDYAFSTPQGGDLVIYRLGAGFARGEVLAPEPGKKLRIRQLGKQGEAIVSQQDAWYVQRKGHPSRLSAALDDGAPIETGDILQLRDGSVLRAARVESIDGAIVTITQGYRQGGGEFRATAKGPSKVSRSKLEAAIVTTSDTLAPGNIILRRSSSGWIRLSIVAELKHLSLKVTDSAGVESTTPKQDLLRVR